MLIADTHVHSDFSADAEDTIKDMCEVAIDKGLSFICFTEHIDENPKSEGLNFFDAEKYLNTIEEVGRKYKEEIIILSGVEFSEPQLYSKKFKKVLAKNYDSLLGSIHWIDDILIGHEELINLYNTQEIFEKYYDLVLEMTEHGGFNVLAHLDLPKRYIGVEYENSEVIKKILRIIIEKDIALEINTSTLRRGLNESMPGSKILALYSELGGKKVTIGSDAHRIQDIASDFNYALKIVDKYGFDNGYYKNGEFEYLWF